jgi:hypothetical protein
MLSDSIGPQTGFIFLVWGRSALMVGSWISHSQFQFDICVWSFLPTDGNLLRWKTSGTWRWRAPPSDRSEPMLCCVLGICGQSCRRPTYALWEQILCPSQGGRMSTLTASGGSKQTAATSSSTLWFALTYSCMMDICTAVWGRTQDALAFKNSRNVTVRKTIWNKVTHYIIHAVLLRSTLSSSGVATLSGLVSL